jgi:DNA-directed RNA polymerase specialized sigma24 family protein
MSPEHSMDIDWVYEGCDEHDEARIDRHWRERQMELEGRLAALSEDPSELRIAVNQDHEAERWDVLAALHAGGRTLTAEASSDQVELALDKVLGSLARKIDRLEEEPERVTLRRQGLEGIEALLERSRRQEQGNAFVSFLLPLVRDLRPYVRRELRMHQIENGLASGQVTVPDVLDEVLVRAWAEFPQRTRQLPLDLWLVQLADRVLHESNRSVASESLDQVQELPSKEVREAARDEWIEQPAYPESLELSELLPGGEETDSWDRMDVDTKQTRLAELLSGLPRMQRQALVLTAAHGFDVAEVADFQGRSSQEVQDDLAAARLAMENRAIQTDLDDVQERLERDG